MMKEGTMTLM